jgi:hypothetical protein
VVAGSENGLAGGEMLEHVQWGEVTLLLEMPRMIFAYLEERE